MLLLPQPPEIHRERMRLSLLQEVWTGRSVARWLYQLATRAILRAMAGLLAKTRWVNRPIGHNRATKPPKIHIP